jgi:hypothetical protein
MASIHPSIPVLDLAGTPAQLGAAHEVMHVTNGCACEGGYHAVALA